MSFNKIILLSLMTIISQLSYGQSLNLANYTLEKVYTYPGITDMSGITYNPESNSLFAVENNTERIFEISLDGILIRTISFSGAEDTEGIVHIEGSTFAIVEERRGRVYFVDINTSTTNINYGSEYVQFSGIWGPNDGLEGICYDIDNERLYAIKEKNNRTLYRFDRPTTTLPTTVSPSIPFNLHTASSSYSPPMTDVAGLAFTQYNNLIILGEESSSLVEVNPWNGSVISSLDISGADVEGVTLDCDNNLYIIAEPNTLYKYAPADNGPQIGDFTPLAALGQSSQFVLPSTHNFQVIIAEGDALTEGGTLKLSLIHI